MAVYKDKNGTWFASFFYDDWQGVHKRKFKRGFKTRREAQEYEREFLVLGKHDMNMTFGDFYKLYERDLRDRLKQSTWVMKSNVIENKILPYFKDRKMCDIKVADIIRWQNFMMEQKDANGKKMAPTYLKTIHNQLSAIFNHAVRFYELKSNPAAKAGNMGKEKTREMLFWTKDEYLKFSDVMLDKPEFYYAFEMLYWCGLRMGEMLALTSEDFDFEKETVHITKSYQRINGKDVITDPKTPKSNRVVQMPKFLVDEMRDYIKGLYGIKSTDRVFPITKSGLHREMRRGCEVSGVKKIRIHDLRHSHVSLLIDMGFTALAIADRVGHESIDITYRYAHLFPTKQGEIANKLDTERRA